MHFRIDIFMGVKVSKKYRYFRIDPAHQHNPKIFQIFPNLEKLIAERIIWESLSK